MTREEAITLMDELQVCIKEHPIIADWLVEIANRKTETNSSEKPNNSTISKMEQVDEPKTQMKTQNSNLTFEKRTMLDCYNCKYFCTENCRECHYEPKDKPQMNPCDGCVCDDGKHLMYCMNCKGIAVKTEPPKIEDEPQTIKVGMATDSVTGKVLGVTLDTDCAWNNG